MDIRTYVAAGALKDPSKASLLQRIRANRQLKKHSYASKEERQRDKEMFLRGKVVVGLDVLHQEGDYSISGTLFTIPLFVDSDRR